MFNSPVDVAMVAGVVLMLVRPWKWKPETYEKNMNSPVDPFALKLDKLFFNRDKEQRK
jgi:hypothetical protein